MSKALILVVEDDPLQRRLIKQNLESEGYTVFEAATGKAALETVRTNPIDLAVVDYRLGEEKGTTVIQEMLAENPLLTAIVVTAYANIENAVEAMRKGAYDYITKPIDFERFRLAAERALERQKLRREVSVLRSSLEERFSAKNFIMASSRMEEVGRLIARAAKSDATVLIQGETGTGKDLVARSIHQASRRKDGPFLALNIPSLPETLVESELFGAEKGSYTGATERRIGKFEAASRGTLFLDEIGDLGLSLQVKLLRVLQDGEFYRLGSSRPLRADVRIIAASNRDLESRMAAEEFRADLYYRLNVISITVPPLRQRKEDIPPLVDFFIKKYGAREEIKIEGVTREAMSALLRYPFPGNVRELENIVERAVVLGEGHFLTLEDLPVFIKEKPEEEIGTGEKTLTDMVRGLEIREIKKALLEANGIKSKAARTLGITERMLSYKIKIYGISV
ncbi:MAG: sigma-54-dependent Fis family transcriptional regulator [Candidatus Aminicenantes bacterium]|nr:sigma-54-dependent Fis family transcriptional regulator [Candidatus Aminicenantes bacterium]